MRANEYWSRVVQPLVRRFGNEPTAHDLAFACCVVMYHVTDYIRLENKKSKNHIIESLVDKHGHFATVLAVASAVKHVEALDKRHGELIGLKSAEADVGKGAAFSDGTYWSDNTSWTDSPDVVRVYAPDGHVVDLHWLVVDVAKTIEEYLTELDQECF